MIVETAIIGGSGLYDLEGIQDVQNIDITTPYGDPSDSVTVGNLDGVSVAFLPRHGRGHKINPTQVPYRANIFALKTLGVKRIISVSAVGSLVEELPPRSLVIPDQVMIDQLTSTIL
jgi:Purine nucleoside phosphorylase